MSITSMSARANMAQKLSIPQLQQAIQDGIIPPYVGVPLLQEKVKMAKTAQAAQAAQMVQQQPNVTQQVMAEAQQVEQGVPALPTNLPAQMAGGGIVAFAEGGMYDDEDDYEDRIDEARRAEVEDLMDEYARTFQGGIGQLPAAKESSLPASAAAAKSNLPYEREGITGADTSDFLAKIMHKESRGRRYGNDGELLTSPKGAKGEMQVMPGTSRDPGYGVKPARDSSPDELARVGRDYAQMLLARYGDPKLAAIAYNMGPGATDKWLAAGADVSKLPRETQGYVKGFSGQDGESEVKDKYKGLWPYNAKEAGKFTYGDHDSPQTDYERQMSEVGGFFGDIGKGIIGGIGTLGKHLVSAPGYGFSSQERPDAKPQTKLKTVSTVPAGGPDLLALDAQRRAAAGQKAQQEVDTGLAKDAALNARIDKMMAPVAKTQAAVTQAAAADPYAEFKDLFAKREANIAKQREQDKYMALLQAGLGMMGGTSQHALANIGAGATQGIQSLAQANAARTAEENALLSGRLGLAKIGGAKEQADAMMQLRRDLAKTSDERARDLAAANLEERQLRRTEGTETKAMQRLADISKNAEIQAEKAIAANTALNFAADREAKKQAMIADILRRNAAYAKTYKMVHGADADPFEGLGGGMPTGDNAGWSIKPK